MVKNLEKVVFGLACTGAVVGALCLYTRNHSSKKKLEEDFRDFTDEFEDNAYARNYTDIPYTSATEA
ncbi:MAG TPA: hypothetical protein IAB71_07585 [Candidatus Scatomonas pullistercoris]|uniref:Uncharacterized protein n=1 Tax=Candidatus Scatomonas pullistercoris TaxID=2840920 RepID=A0A9D1P3H1_9FIRM|nr:hypothetical protein [Candidatus Scatomonas pullistercoris]